jgi:hypothetical protein
VIQPGNLADHIRLGAMAGRTPAEVKAMTLAEFIAFCEGHAASKSAKREDEVSDEEVLAALAEELGKEA